MIIFCALLLSLCGADAWKWRNSRPFGQNEQVPISPEVNMTTVKIHFNYFNFFASFCSKFEFIDLKSIVVFRWETFKEFHRHIWSRGVRTYFGHLFVFLSCCVDTSLRADSGTRITHRLASSIPVLSSSFEAVVFVFNSLLFCPL